MCLVRGYSAANYASEMAADNAMRGVSGGERDMSTMLGMSNNNPYDSSRQGYEAPQSTTGRQSYTPQPSTPAYTPHSSMSMPTQSRPQPSAPAYTPHSSMSMPATDPRQGQNISGTGASAAPTISCLLYTSPSPRDRTRSRMPSSA